MMGLWSNKPRYLRMPTLVVATGGLSYPKTGPATWATASRADSDSVLWSLVRRSSRSHSTARS